MLKFGTTFAAVIRKRQTAGGDKWHLDEVGIAINGEKHWLWRAVDQHCVGLDVLVQRRRDTRVAARLMRKLLRRQGHAPRVMITDKLRSYGAAAIGAHPPAVAPTPAAPGAVNSP